MIQLARKDVFTAKLQLLLRQAPSHKLVSENITADKKRYKLVTQGKTIQVLSGITMIAANRMRKVLKARKFIREQQRYQSSKCVKLTITPHIKALDYQF